MTLYVDLRDKVLGGLQPLPEAAGPETYAARLARYIRDPSTIRARTINEYGRAPSIERIQEMVAQAREKSAAIRMAALRDVPDEGEDAQLWATPGLARMASERREAAIRIAAQLALARLDEAEGCADSPRRELASLRDIITMAAHAFGLTHADIIGRSRKTEIVAIRYMVAWILLKRGRLSSSQVGRALGGRDHSSALYGRDRFEERATPEQRDFALRLVNWRNPMVDADAAPPEPEEREGLAA